MTTNSILGILIPIVIPVIVAIAVLSSERLTAPELAEHHRRDRKPGARWDRLEIIAAIVIAVLVMALLVLGLIDLWVHRTPF